MPEDRARLYEAFIRRGMENFIELTKSAENSGESSLNEIAETLNDTLGLREVSRIIGCSAEKAKNILNELMELEIVGQDSRNQGYRWIV